METPAVNELTLLKQPELAPQMRPVFERVITESQLESAGLVVTTLFRHIETRVTPPDNYRLASITIHQVETSEFTSDLPRPRIIAFRFLPLGNTFFDDAHPLTICLLYNFTDDPDVTGRLTFDDEGAYTHLEWETGEPDTPTASYIFDFLHTPPDTAAYHTVYNDSSRDRPLGEGEIFHISAWRYLLSQPAIFELMKQPTLEDHWAEDA